MTRLTLPPGINVNRGHKICLRLRYPNDNSLFLPTEEVVDTMLHEYIYTTLQYAQSANGILDYLTTSSVLTTTNFTNYGKSSATSTKNSPSKASPATLSYQKGNASAAATSPSRRCDAKLVLQLSCGSNERQGSASDLVVHQSMLGRTFDK